MTTAAICWTWLNPKRFMSMSSLNLHRSQRPLRRTRNLRGEKWCAPDPVNAVVGFQHKIRGFITIGRLLPPQVPSEVLKGGRSQPVLNCYFPDGQIKAQREATGPQSHNDLFLKHSRLLSPKSVHTVLFRKQKGPQADMVNEQEVSS